MRLWTQCLQIWLLKRRSKFGLLDFYVKISLLATKQLNSPISPPTHHSHLLSHISEQKTKNLCAGQIKSVYSFHLLWVLWYWCLWSGPAIFHPRWENGCPEKRWDLTKVISKGFLLKPPMKSWWIIHFKKYDRIKLESGNLENYNAEHASLFNCL